MTGSSQSRRILVVIGAWEGAKGWGAARALEELGHTVSLFDDWNFGFTRYTLATALLRLAAWAPPVSRILTRLASLRFRVAASRIRPEIILVIRGDRVEPDAVAAAKQTTGAVTVNWLSDNPLLVPALLRAAQVYDRLYVKDSYVQVELGKLGLDRVGYLGQCCAPELHRTVPLTPAQQAFYGSDLAVVGVPYPLRLRYLERLTDFDLKVWVDHPAVRLPRRSVIRRYMVRHKAFGLEQTRVFNAARIVLNTHHPQDIHGVNLRTFEAAGCGAFQLVDWKPDLPRFFEPEQEMVTFRTLAELRDLARYFLDHPEERKRIAERAQKRAHAEHTYRQRMLAILGDL
ncbi:MAG: glycosyltransferase [Candidatus Rokubacteria bacterium]|nr:glycosyltransferase [Candidatus Rokubacteria bacterium]